jgi:hypothetical protein
MQPLTRPRRVRDLRWLVACLLVLPAMTAAQVYPPPPVLPPPGHPRVYFTAADLPRLRENATKPQNASAWKQHLQYLKKGTDGQLRPPSSPEAGNVDSYVLSIISSLAYDYVLRGDEANGRAAIAALRNYHRTVVYPPKDYNNTGQAVYTTGLVYDWCYPLLSDDDKQFFIQATLDTAARMEIGWPPVKQGNVTGHGPEGQIFRDLLVASIAMHDENPEMYQLVAGRFFDRMIEPKKFMYPAHMHHQGSHYMNYRGQWELFPTLIFRPLGIENVFGPEQRYFMHWALYARRGDGQLLRDGDTHINNRRPGEFYAAHYRSVFLLANAFGDPHLKMEAHRQRPDFEPVTPRGNQATDAVETLIFNDPDLEPRPLEELPLTKYFPPPKGAMIARTGWQDGIDSPAVVAEMKINEWYFANHQHLDAGAFQVYYRGALAIDSGYYQAAVNRTNTPENAGSSGYGSLYDLNYNKRSIAHNVVLVHDPDERFEASRWADFPIANDGGQRMPNRWKEPTEHEEFIDPANGYRIAEVLGRGFGPDARMPDYTYLKGDLAEAYTSKVRGYERSFVFLNLEDPTHPAAMVVFDRVESSNPVFRKAWLVHGLEKPTIDGNRVVFKDTRAGYTGKLTIDTLLPMPDDATLTTIGGPGREAFVDGTNYLVKTREGTINEGGSWRVEVSPKTPRALDHFLHVLQVADHTPDAAPLPVARIETPTHAGARVGDRVVLFAKSRDRRAEPVAFDVPGSDSARTLVADLQAGRWQVQQPDAAPQTIDVPADSGVAWFTARPGRCTLVRLDAAGH